VIKQEKAVIKHKDTQLKYKDTEIKQDRAVIRQKDTKIKKEEELVHEIVRRMAQKRISLQSIREITGLKKKEIEKIIKNI